jgi:hypothetical protein
MGDGRKGFTPEQIIKKLGEAETLLAWGIRQKKKAERRVHE